MADLNLFSSPYEILDSSRRQIFKEIFLLHQEIVCCVYSLKSPLRDNSNDDDDFRFNDASTHEGH